jgi:two-component system KDP operon response regulator KdpE
MGEGWVRVKRVLVIDDDADIVELVRTIFAREGAEVYSASDGRKGILEFGACQPDLILLDIMMPHMDGWETCRLFRQFTDVPIVFLTALDGDRQIIRGLDCGAVDYVTKPFSPNALLARARAALRKSTLGSTPRRKVAYDDGYLALDVDGHEVWVGGKQAQLTATEYRLLVYLVEHAGQVLTYEQILDHVWGWQYRGSVGYVHVYISHLRRKIERDPASPAYLLTERGVGYRFAPKNSRRQAEAT